jgi:hypothetical protein
MAESETVSVDAPPVVAAAFGAAPRPLAALEEAEVGAEVGAELAGETDE